MVVSGKLVRVVIPNIISLIIASCGSSVVILGIGRVAATGVISSRIMTSIVVSSARGNVKA